MNLKLDLNFKTILPVLRKLQVYIFGLLLVGIFAYTAYEVNLALNVQPATLSPESASTAGATKITYDAKTIAALKKLSSVSGEVPTGDLGTTDPFR